MSLVSLSLLVLAATGSVFAAPSRQTCGCENTANNASLKAIYHCGDPLLGPVELPTEGPVVALLKDYDPFAGQCPGAFLTSKGRIRNGSYVYPDREGFELDCGGSPIFKTFDLTPGQLVDRFGPPGSAFLGVPGASYRQRAIAPKNLKLVNGNSPYRVYRILKSFRVKGGIIRPAFGQPGGGYQYVANETNIQTVQDLLNGEYLTDVTEYMLSQNEQCEGNKSECGVNPDHSNPVVGSRSCNGGKWEFNACESNTTCKIKGDEATCMAQDEV